jgi:large subunit ribosomal protein L17
MRHNKHHASLGVTREHRGSMMSNLAAALITHDRIETTLAKAKALRPFIEKVITKAKHAAAKEEKKDAVHLRRLALRDVRDEDAVTLLFNEKYKVFADRAGGYTRIYKLGPQRLGDAAEMALQEVKGQEVRRQGQEEEARRAGGRAVGPGEGAHPGGPRRPRGRGEGLEGPAPVRPNRKTRRSLPSARFLFRSPDDRALSRLSPLLRPRRRNLPLAVALLRPQGPPPL